MGKWRDQTDGVYIEKFDFNVKPDFHAPGRLQLHGQKIVEYSKTHRSICGDINTMTEAIIQIHHLAYNQSFSPTFDKMS